MPRLRLIASIALSLLLFVMQLGALVHALEHDGARLACPHGATLVTSGADQLCPICASFAAGSHASPSSDRPFACVSLSATGIVAKFTAIAGAAPTYYQSRGPPPALSTFV